jgi:hypothetical protein
VMSGADSAVLPPTQSAMHRTLTNDHRTAAWSCSPSQPLKVQEVCLDRTAAGWHIHQCRQYNNVTRNNQMSSIRYRRLLVFILAFAFGQVLAGPLDSARNAYSNKEYRRAADLYLPLAQGGDATAQFNLGVMYDQGQGVPRDDQQALYWYRKAADQDFVEAQFNIGIMYAIGQGMPKDFKQAADWYRKAAIQGYVEASRALANLYLFGQGVPRSETKSKYWNQVAANQAVDNARAEQEEKRLADQAAENNRLMAEAARAAKEAEKNSTVGGQDGISQAKRTCADIGFKPATEKFGDCVLQMVKASGAPGSIGVPTVAANQSNVLTKARLAEVTVPTPSYAPQPPQFNSPTNKPSFSDADRAGRFIVTNEGCELWNPLPEDGGSVSWSGACSNGLVEGNGVATWYKNKELYIVVNGVATNGRVKSFDITEYQVADPSYAPQAPLPVADPIHVSPAPPQVVSPQSQASASKNFDWGDFFQRLGNAGAAYNQHMQKNRPMPAAPTYSPPPARSPLGRSNIYDRNGNIKGHVDTGLFLNGQESIYDANGKYIGRVP